MKILKIECFAGAAGDMFLGAFADLGMDIGYLERELDRLGLPIRLEFEKELREGLAGTKCRVIDLSTGLEADRHEHNPGSETHSYAGHDHDHDDHNHHDHDGHNHHDHDDHDHDHEHDHHGHTHTSPEHDHIHEHEHGRHDHGDEHDHHEHEHDHHDHGHHHHHAHRSFSDIRRIIFESTLSTEVKEEAVRVFGRLAQAEGRVHGKPADEVAFHEAGALDSIADIVGCVICFDWLRREVGVERIYVSPVNTGTGTIRCAHGLLPVPVPAVLGVMEDSGIPIYGRDIDTEALTPTGAVLLASYGQYDPDLVYAPLKRGIGFGSKRFKIPNALRLIIGETAAAEVRTEPDVEPDEEILQIETQTDDMTGEEAGYLTQRLLDTSGVLDAYWTGVTMKKSRPGMLLTVLCRKEALGEASEIIFRDSSAIGLRYFPVSRLVMKREIVPVDTSYGTIRVKKVSCGDIEKAAPEYEDLKAAAQDSGSSVRDICLEVMGTYKGV